MPNNGIKSIFHPSFSKSLRHTDGLASILNFLSTFTGQALRTSILFEKFVQALLITFVKLNLSFPIILFACRIPPYFSLLLSISNMESFSHNLSTHFKGNQLLDVCPEFAIPYRKSSHCNWRVLKHNYQ